MYIIFNQLLSSHLVRNFFYFSAMNFNIKLLSILYFIFQLKQSLAIYANKTELEDVDNESPLKWADEGIWGPILEDWAVSHKREKRVLYNESPEKYNISIDDRQDKETKIGGGKIVSNNNGFIPSPQYNPPKKTQSKPVSETDLYLLGAIEKLVYKVDFMEKRLRRVEEMLYYVMAGNRMDQDPCPDNFTRVGSHNCYLFGSMAGREYDWKASSKQCKKFGATLAEFESIEETQDVIAFIQSNPHLKGKDFWTGGLNPGLLWIWSNSARPVKTPNNTNSKQNPTEHILGDGRCLRLAYNPALRSYAYKGTDCSIRYNYICEQIETTSSNEIRRIGRKMKIINDEL